MRPSFIKHSQHDFPLQDVVRDAIFYQLRQHLKNTLGIGEGMTGQEGLEASPELPEDTDKRGILIEDVTSEGGEPMEIDEQT